MADKPKTPFWETKTLAEMTVEEWESLCDGCGRCCLIRLEDEETGEQAETNVACKLLDIGACRCTDYENRAEAVPDCKILTPQNVGELTWMPSSCAYRRLAEGRKLEWWHPLVSGRAESVHEAGISVASYAISEDEVSEADWEEHIQAIEKREGW